jgi:hypothetical protein
MNPHTTFERELQGWLAADALASAPAGLHDMVIERARTTRQRPSWLVSLRGGAFPSPAGAIGRPAARLTYLLVVLGLVLALIAVAIAAGALRSQPVRVLGWTTTGSMIEAPAGRGGTTTLLRNGKVLVAGPAILAASGEVDLNWAELYDPGSGTWTATAKMIMPRDVGGAFTATLLRNGKVLVTGGDFGWFTPQLYDPDSGTWTVTGSMLENHAGPAALLPDGKVLVAGGANGDQASAEVYDPGTGTWTATGSMTTGRHMATATVLLDGRVLVAGGGHWLLGSATAELYDPASGTWTATGSMTTLRGYQFTATLLPDGRVLAVGGFDRTEATLASAELYDPASGTWTATADMGTPRGVFNATLLLDGRVLVAGGFPIGTSAELYDPGSP